MFLLVQAAKAYQGQTLKLTMKIRKSRTKFFITLAPVREILGNGCNQDKLQLAEKNLGPVFNFMYGCALI